MFVKSTLKTHGLSRPAHFRSLHSPAQHASYATKQFHLRSFPPSTCSWRVRAALYHFRIDFTTQNVDLLKARDNETEEYIERWNRLGQVPVLVVREERSQEYKISQSIAAIEYLNALMEKEGKTDELVLPSVIDESLNPDTLPLMRASIMEFAEVVNSAMQPLQNTRIQRMVKRMLREGTPKQEGTDPKAYSQQLDERLQRDWTEVHLRRGCQKLEQMLTQYRGSKMFFKEKSAQEIAERDVLAPYYCVGKRLSLADLCFVPQIYSISERTSINVQKEFPGVWETYKRLSQLECFEETNPDNSSKRDEFRFNGNQFERRDKSEY